LIDSGDINIDDFATRFFPACESRAESCGPGSESGGVPTSLKLSRECGGALCLSCCKPLDEDIPNHGSDRRDHKTQTNSIRDESGCQQQRATKHDQRTVGNLLGGKVPTEDLLLNADEHARSFPSNQPGADGAYQQHQSDSWKRAESLTDLQNHIQLDQGDHDEEKKNDAKHLQTV